LKSLNIDDFVKLFSDRYTSYFIYNLRSNSSIFNDYRNDFLTVTSFKHSTKLEFIFAFFPTAIISIIVVPSLYSLYSVDEDLDQLLL